LESYLDSQNLETLDLKIPEMISTLQTVHNAVAYVNSYILVRRSKNLVNLVGVRMIDNCPQQIRDGGSGGGK
jgi:hypothetical protein